jgi:hypothetical protein
MKKYVAFALFAVVTYGCFGGPKLDTRTFEIKHLDTDAVYGLIEPYIYTDRPEAQGKISFAGDLVTVRETSDNLDKIGRVLAQYDIPRPSVRLQFQVIEADGAAQTDPAIADVERQLRQLFRFDGYSLVGEAVIGGTENSSVSQEFGSADEPYFIRVEILNVRGNADSGSVRLEVEFSTMGGGSLATTVNARAGQTVVLGNAQLRRGGGTLILVVKPELVVM